MKLNKNSTTILFATFSPWVNGLRLPTNGSLEPIRDFFLPRVKQVILIDQPIPGSDFVLPRTEVYTNGRFDKIVSSSWYVSLLGPILWSNNVLGTQISFKIRDFLSVIDASLRTKKTDVFIGLESINAIAGIILKKLGRVRTVVYYVSDYSPNRYPQKWFNTLYLWLDRFAAKHSDFIWDVSPAMQPQRIKAGLDPQKACPVIHVPNGLFKNQITAGKVKEKIKDAVMYMGTLGPENGVDMLIEAMPIVLKKVPNATLHIIGGGEDNLERLQQITKKLSLTKRVIFYGFIQDSGEMAQTLAKGEVAVIPYLSWPDSPRWYADANKIRAYAAAGLPTVTTHVPPLGQEAAKQGAAIVVADTPEELAKGIIKVLHDKLLNRTMSKAAVKFAENSTWDNTFSNAFSQM